MRRLILGLLVIALSLPLVNGGSYTTTAYGKSVTQLQKEKADLEKKKKEAKAAANEANAKKKTIADEIIALDEKVNAAEAKLAAVEEQLEETQKKLTAAEKELATATEKKEKQMEAFKKRIKFIYENGSIGYLQILFQAKNFNDFLVRRQYVNDIMNSDKELLDDLKKNQTIITLKTEEIKQEKEKNLVLVAEAEARTSELQEQLSAKKTLSAQIEKDATKYEQELASWTKASNEVERLILQASAKSNNSSTIVTYTGGVFAWPVPGHSRRSSEYGYRSRPIGSGTEFHTGYDIPAPYGTNIVAAADGKVITSSYVNGYGNTIMIDHGGGLVTLYGHNSRLTVSVGQTVTKGQVIAKCGSTGNSTGNHCHFEVRKNGKHTSPKPYLGV